MLKTFEKMNYKEESNQILQDALNEFGFVPNFIKLIAKSPVTYTAYTKNFELLFHNTSLSMIESQIILLTISVKNKCAYDIAAHSWGLKMSGVPIEIIDSIIEGNTVKDIRLQELSFFTIDLINSCGKLSSDRINRFLSQGYKLENIFEILIAISTKTISNLANNLDHTQIDPEMK